MSYDPGQHGVCQCAACRHQRDYEETEEVCFADMMREADDNGHGPCIDPWGIGCTCTGTAVDGECEGCWLWLK